ncbi:MAG: c-type cytochrome [Rhizobiales bacterium]|nr:c-type cytochrome [Hyphomicrobiales bacterium]
MSRSPERVRRLRLALCAATFALSLGLGSSLPSVAVAGDAAKGATVFKKCSACHMVGEGAKNRVGPHLNDIFGRTSGSLEGFKFSNAMKEAGAGGLVWTTETLSGYLADPRGYMKGNRMSFVGLKKPEELADVIAYLATFSPGSAAAPAQQDAPAPASGGSTGSSSNGTGASTTTATAAVETPPASAPTDSAPAMPLSTGPMRLGRLATPAEIAAWDIDVRPDGAGLPEGRGTVADGEVIFAERCAVCHGDFGEGVDRWPVLAGGQDTLKSERPEKTVGSFWPYLSTVWDYIHRSMPFGDAQSLTDDEVYAVTAYLLYMNDVVTDENFELNHENFATVRLPNEASFYMDDRDSEPFAKPRDPCMENCRPGTAEVIGRARVLDVTPDDDGAGQGAIE